MNFNQIINQKLLKNLKFKINLKDKEQFHFIKMIWVKNINIYKNLIHLKSFFILHKKA